MPRPRTVSRSANAGISNGEMARVFREIGDMLEILGEVVYKSVAYRRVADAVERYPDDVAALYRRGTPPRIPGAGEALSAKLAELAETGSLGYHDRLRAQVPDGLLAMLRIPGVGPRTVKLLHAELGIDSVEALRAAAEDGRLRGVKGLSQRTEENVLAGIARLERVGSRLLLHEGMLKVNSVVADNRGENRELFDLTLDPAELTNVVEGHRDVQRELHARLFEAIGGPPPFYEGEAVAPVKR